MNFSEVQQNYSAVMPTYARYDVAFASGTGSTLIDTAGKQYIDFASGIGVNSVGYAHPKWINAVTEQAKTLAHASNLYYTLPAMELANKLVNLTGMKNVFFSNSGAEANEGMIKCARKYSHDKYDESRSKIVTLVNSFHGRTITTLAATGQDVFHQNFQPFTDGFVHVEMGDIDALTKLNDDICAVMVEPVQGEGGVLPCTAEFLQQLADLCKQRDWLLLFDEVQTGVGRCGEWFAFIGTSVKPDLVSFAKGIAGGLPFGGFIAAESVADVLTAGKHATTFGGNPICAAAALATLEIIEEILPDVHKKGEYIREKIQNMNLSCVKNIRGLGLMIGIEIDIPIRDTVANLLENGLVTLTAGKNCIRLLPPLTISMTDIDKGLAIFEKTLG